MGGDGAPAPDHAHSRGLQSRYGTQISRLGFVYALSVFVITLNYRLNILILQQLSTLDQVGIYSLGPIFAELIWQIPTALSNIVFSRSVNAAKPEEFTAKVLVLARLALACGTLVAIVLAIALHSRDRSTGLAPVFCLRARET